MKLVSSVALGAALLLGSTTSVFAAKEKVPAAPAYKIAPNVRPLLATAQAAVKAKDPTAGEKVAAAEAIATQPDEKFVAAQLRLELAISTADKAAQRKAINAIIASGSTNISNLPRLQYSSGSLAYEARDYAAALPAFIEAERLGYKDDDILILIADTYFRTNNVSAGLPYVDKAIATSEAAGKKAPEAWYKRAASAAYNAKMSAEASKWTRAQVRAYPTAENWRSALVIYRDSGPRDGQLNLDVFRLMRQSKALAGERDYYELASLAAERGLVGEAKSVLDEGQATSAFPAGSKAIADIRSIVNPKLAADRASLATSERQAGTAATGKLAAATADAYLGYGDNAKALALYKTAMTKGGVDADAVNTRMGIALARLGQKAEAKAAFAAVKPGPRAEIAAFWSLWVDQQA